MQVRAKGDCNGASVNQAAPARFMDTDEKWADATSALYSQGLCIAGASFCVLRPVVGRHPPSHYLCPISSPLKLLYHFCLSRLF